MKKNNVTYLFIYLMIFLVLFNFYACTKQSAVNPINTPNKTLEIIFVDDNDNISKNKTNNILMQLEDDDSGFYMFSTKKDDKDYVAYLIDSKNNSSISMYYENGSLFPYKIMLVQGNESLVGYTSKHRRDSEDFDIIWYSEYGSDETVKNIPLKNSIYDHSPSVGVESDTDYQIKTIKISLRISDAINKYVDNNDTIKPMARSLFKSFSNFWKKVFAAIVIVVAVVIAIFVPPLAPTMIEVISNAMEYIKVLDIKAVEEDKEKAASGVKKLFISKKVDDISEVNLYKNNDEIRLDRLGDSFYIFFDIVEAEIDKFKIKAEMENEPNGYNLIGAYYKISKDNDGKCYSVDKDNVLLPETKFNNNQDFYIKIEKAYNDVGNNKIYMDIEVGASTMINGNAASSFRLILKP
ncbi:hypothetical protein [uncultured Brachyspira sp.]|uniref:hypothetical protein n=1 Tax=uncultured Brachyspira sp. TaxID=221953 RepID=UPI0025EF1EE9|nr:hypothetical protein [uncultured Brachyspira sp.]